MTEVHPIVDAMLTRRSVRFGFEDRPVPQSVLAKIVECGLAAPSSKNAQPWRFHVVTDQKVHRKLAGFVRAARGVESYVPHDPNTGMPYGRYRSTVLESADVLLEVPAAIWVENLGAFTAGRRTLLSVPAQALAASLEGYGLELVGIGAAIENMWIAAHAHGLAAAFMGDVVIAEDQVQASLEFTGDLVGVLALGYSAADPPPPMDTRAFEQSDRVVWH